MCTIGGTSENKRAWGKTGEAKGKTSMQTFLGRTAVITGAASGFGLETARLAVKRGMNVVLADVQQEALNEVANELSRAGAQVISHVVDVSKADQVEALANATFARFGAPHFVFNNAGVAFGGLIWEHSERDWEWVLGVNLFGVVHGVRVFTPRMLQAAKDDPSYEGHIVNTASMAGLVNAPNMGAYSVSKHAVVSLSETLYHDLSLVTDRVHASVLCPYFIPTGIHNSERNRPQAGVPAQLTKSQRINQVMSERAVKGGKMSAQQIAELVFQALREKRFYIYSHPHALGGVKTRMDDILAGSNPTDPFSERPEVSAQLRDALKD